MENSQIKNKSHSKSTARNRNKIRHRLSDAKWRANLARCYGGLRRVLINRESSDKRKVTKATILKETVNHIHFLENTIEALMREKAHRDGNQCGPLPWKSSLDYFRYNFLAYEEELNKVVSDDATNFTSTISNSSHPSVRMDIANKKQTIGPVKLPQSLHGSFCSNDHCYHLVSSMPASSQASLQFVYSQNKEPSNSDMVGGWKSNGECNGVRRKPLGEINNVITKISSRKHFIQHSFIKCETGVGKTEKDLGIWKEPTPLSQFSPSNYAFPTQATPSSHYVNRKYSVQSNIKPKYKRDFISGVRRRIFSSIDKNDTISNHNMESSKNDLWHACHNHESNLLNNIHEDLQYDSSSSNDMMKNPVTGNQVSSLQSPYHDPNFCYRCPPTPVKINKFKDIPSLKRRFRSRRALEKLMNKATYRGNSTCVDDENADFKTEINSQHDEKTEISSFPRKRIQEHEALSLDDSKNFMKDKASREMSKAPVIMKIQKATGSLQDKNHDQMTDKENCNYFLSYNDNSALDCMSFQSKDLSKLEELNQEVPDNEIFCKKQSHSCAEVPHLPEIQYRDNSNIVVLLLCKNANRGDQEVPKTFPYSTSLMKNSTKCSDEIFVSPPCKIIKDVADDVPTLQTLEAFHSVQRQLNDTSNVTKQNHTHEGMLKSSHQEAGLKNANKNSQCFLMQEQDPILTSANFTMKQTNMSEYSQKTSLVESPNKISADNTQYTACQQTGCCWSPCQELSSASLFDTGYHEVNEER